MYQTSYIELRCKKEIIGHNVLSGIDCRTDRAYKLIEIANETIACSKRAGERQR